MIKGVHRTLMLYADILIDAHGVSRKLFGLPMVSVPWKNISLIKVHDRHEAAYMVNYIKTRKEKAYCIELYSDNPSFNSILFGRKMIMWSEGNLLAGASFYKIVNALNEYVKKYSIKVESTLNGSISYPSELPTALQ